MKSLYLTALVGLMSSVSFADEAVQIRPEIENTCSELSYDQAKRRFMSFESYDEFDNSITTSVWDLSPIPPILEPVVRLGGSAPGANVPPLNMVEATVKDRLPVSEREEIDRVNLFFAISPIGLHGDTAARRQAHPRIYVTCKIYESTVGTKRELRKVCRDWTQKRHYGLQTFSADFVITEADSYQLKSNGESVRAGCLKGEIKIDYEINLVTRDSDIDNTKQVLKGQYRALSWLPDAQLDMLFNAQLFFTSYFNDLYSIILSD